MIGSQGQTAALSIAVLISVFIASLLFPLFSARTDYIGKKIGGIHFAGLGNVKDSDLLPLLTMQVGDTLKESSLNGDIKALFETGYFSNVILHISLNDDKTINIVIEVVELPRIQKIDFLGVEELYATDLKTVLPFREGDVYSRQKVIDGVASIKKKYRDEGYFLAEVWERTEKLNPKTNTIDVTYIVDEGENIPVSRINIIGTHYLDPEDILGVLEQKEEGLFESGTFKEGTFEEDKYRILAYAKSKGFIDAEIDPEGTGYEIRWKNPSRPEAGRVVVITYKIREGQIRFFGGYSLEDDPKYINEELNPPERKMTKPGDLIPVFKPKFLLQYTEFSDDSIGDVFDEGKFFRDRGLIQDMYASRGYVYAQVQPVFVNYRLSEDVLDRYDACLKIQNPAGDVEQRCKDEAQWIDVAEARRRLKANPEERGHVLRHVHFIVRENHLAYIENIIIKGMVKTQERVIRRELLVKEGQLFNKALVDRSREKLVNLGYFKEVNLQMRPGSDDQKMNLIIDVKEQPTGTVSMGGGYGTTSGFSIFTEVGETNLNGTGQHISGRLQYGPIQRQVSLSWTDPWIYEACEATTGSFWRNKAKEFDEAESKDALLVIADTLQNNYAYIGDKVHSYVEATGDASDVETIDGVKVRIRKLIHKYVEKEEDCWRSPPRPWSLSLSTYYRSYTYTSVSNTVLISDVSKDYFEGSTYDIAMVGVGIGVSHSFWINWAHYHYYRPSWSRATNPSALVSNEILKRVDLNWQFQSSLTNGIIYDNLDNVFSPTRGMHLDFSVDTVGQMLGGQDHYNRYNASTRFYWWWFDYTFGGLFRKNALRRWRVVQEFRFSGIFMHETAPYYKKQDKEVNPYIESYDHLYLGGYETLRGYDYAADRNFPAPWRDGGNHMLLASSELRFPIEPSMLWLVTFLDSGSLYDNVGEYTGDQKTYLNNYRSSIETAYSQMSPELVWMNEHYNLTNYHKYFYDSSTDWNDPRNSVLSLRNVSMERTLFSWGFGIRIQIPVLPLRLYMAQKLYYNGGGFHPIPGDSKFQFVFGIGDFRF